MKHGLADACATRVGALAAICSLNQLTALHCVKLLLDIHARGGEAGGPHMAVVNVLLKLPQRYQHVYMGLLYGVLAMKSVFLDDFASLAGGEIGPVAVARMSAPEAALFWGGKAAFFAAFLGAPILASAHSWAALGALWLVSEAAAGWLLALMFQVLRTTLMAAIA